MLSQHFQPTTNSNQCPRMPQSSSWLTSEFNSQLSVFNRWRPDTILACEMKARILAHPKTERGHNAKWCVHFTRASIYSHTAAIPRYTKRVPVALIRSYSTLQSIILSLSCLTIIMKVVWNCLLSSSLTARDNPKYNVSLLEFSYGRGAISVLKWVDKYRL